MEIGRWVGLLVVAAAVAQTPEVELRDGVSLTSRGQFEQAIPHFLAARAQGADSFALEFNLALCYVGTRQFPDAIRILSRIPAGPRDAEVKNLLAQALIGDRQPDPAWKAFSEAAALTPRKESLYVLVSQAALDEGVTKLARRVLETGLANLSDSAKLHFQMGMLDWQQDEPATAVQEFQKAQSLAPNSEVAYIAEASQALYAGRIQDVIRAAREGVRKGYQHYLLLTMLGDALLRAGATPETPAEFHEAKAALEKAVALRPGYSSSHVALGRAYLALGRINDAIAELESARRLDPRDRSIYPPLAAAYRRTAQPEKSKDALAALAELNRQDAERIRSADGGRAGYVSGKKER